MSKIGRSGFNVRAEVDISISRTTACRHHAGVVQRSMHGCASKHLFRDLAGKRLALGTPERAVIGRRFRYGKGGRR